jgi:hypothetical protein
MKILPFLAVEDYFWLGTSATGGEPSGEAHVAMRKAAVCVRWTALCQVVGNGRTDRLPVDQVGPRPREAAASCNATVADAG